MLFIFSTSFVFAQIEKNNKSPLTIEKIMQDPDKWIGTLPENPFWGEKNEKIYFQWNPEKDTLSSLHDYNLKTGKIEKISLEEQKSLPGRGAEYNYDRTKKVYVKNGNIFLLNIKDGKEKQLTDWLERAGSVTFAMKDTRISFMLNNNLFIIDPETGFIQQITNFAEGQERPEAKLSEQDLWLEHQQ